MDVVDGSMRWRELEGMFQQHTARLTAYAGIRMAGRNLNFDPGDVVQEVWYRALTSASDPGEIDDQRAWLIGMARNVVRGFARARREVGLPASSSSSGQRGLPESVTSISSRIAGQEAFRRLIRHVAQLPPIEQDFVVLRVAGESLRSIARALDVTVHRVRQTLELVREQLGAELPEIAGFVMAEDAPPP